MPFACIFVPDFPVEAILRAEPALRSQAVAVLEGKPPLQKIFVVNHKARRAGIAPGMSKIQVEPCTELVLRPARRCRRLQRMRPCLTARSRSPHVSKIRRLTL